MSEADEAFDFVVLGSGAAGLTGALVAAGEGARVAILEKSELIGGTTAMSGGAFWIPCNHHMGTVGVADTREEALAYLRACAGASSDEALFATLVDEGAPMVRHLEALGLRPPQAWPAIGGTWDYRPWLPGAKQGGRALMYARFELAELGPWADRIRIGTPYDIDMFDYYRQQMYLAPPATAGTDAVTARSRPGAPAGRPEAVAGGTALVGELLRACLARGVRPYTGTRAKRLLVEQGRVVGVEAERGGRAWRVASRQGVLAATGGYTANEELKRQWLNRPLLTTCDVAENEGDGHLMGMAIGAQLGGMGDAWWLPFIHVGTDDHGAVKNIARSREDRTLPHTMIVNRRGRRFLNECTNYYDFAEAFGTLTGAGERNVPAWLIFDAAAVRNYAMIAAKVPPGPTPEWLTVAPSLGALAERLGIDAEGLAETCRRFNGFCREGSDRDFQRGENPWDIAWGDPANRPNPSLGSIDEPPFYAVEVVPGALATKGGLRINGRGEVLSAAEPFGVIPGLYASGNCSSGAPSGCYPGPGTTIGAAMTFAFVAARDALSRI